MKSFITFPKPLQLNHPEFGMIQLFAIDKELTHAHCLLQYEGTVTIELTPFIAYIKESGQLTEELTYALESGGNS